MVRAQAAIVGAAPPDGGFGHRRRGGTTAAREPAPVRRQTAPDHRPEFAVLGTALDEEHIVAIGHAFGSDAAQADRTHALRNGELLHGHAAGGMPQSARRVDIGARALRSIKRRISHAVS